MINWEIAVSAAAGIVLAAGFAGYVFLMVMSFLFMCADSVDDDVRTIGFFVFVFAFLFIGGFAVGGVVFDYSPVAVLEGWFGEE